MRTPNTHQPYLRNSAMTTSLSNAGRPASKTHQWGEQYGPRGRGWGGGRRGEQKFQAKLVISTKTARDVTIEGTAMATMTEDTAYLTTSEDSNVL